MERHPSYFGWQGKLTRINGHKTNFNHIEMGIPDLNKLAEKLSQLPEYKLLFSNAL